MAEFRPITSQEQLDEIVESRLARAKEKWEKESGSASANLRAELEAKDKELARARGEHAVEMTLRDRGLSGPVGAPKAERIKKLLNFDSDTPVSEQLETLSRDVPELFTMPRGAGSRGSRTPILTPKDGPLTREEVEGMSEQEINSNWDRVKAFLAGERG